MNSLFLLNETFTNGYRTEALDIPSLAALFGNVNIFLVLVYIIITVFALIILLSAIGSNPLLHSQFTGPGGKQILNGGYIYINGDKYWQGADGTLWLIERGPGYGPTGPGIGKSGDSPKGGGNPPSVN